MGSHHAYPKNGIKIENYFFFHISYFHIGERISRLAITSRKIGVSTRTIAVSLKEWLNIILLLHGLLARYTAS